ncbi:U3 small nucleolar ribonucleoprotein protein MPP10-like [Venturia canescens]|uniref:U3 small nucleolar ribonucleoprotein protein MPP10-like n=1 Tax=Venturia canescens TaxID=32260 RepID=UPI001C9C5A0A|nr:U3 small nucleolar ribonucleoprotein protein MPP10-like [Venturia canescens]
MCSETVLEQVFMTIDNSTKKFDNFLSHKRSKANYFIRCSVQNDVAAILKTAIKQLHDLTKSETKRKNNALPELIVQDFDEEQIWQQLELLNDGELAHFLGGVLRLVARQNKLVLPVSLVPKKKETAENEGERKKDCGDKCDYVDSEKSDVEMDCDVDFGDKRKRKKREEKKLVTRPSMVDDQFFKLEELDKYLSKEDEKERAQREESSRDSDEESVELFEPDSDDEEEEIYSEDGRMMKYADFFDNPDSGEETEK